MTTPICPVHNVPGRYAFGSMVVCELCHAGTAAVPAAQEKPVAASTTIDTTKPVWDNRFVKIRTVKQDGRKGAVAEFTDELTKYLKHGSPSEDAIPTPPGYRAGGSFSVGYSTYAEALAKEMADYQPKPDDSPDQVLALEYTLKWGRVNRQQHSSRPHALIVPSMGWKAPPGLHLPSGGADLLTLKFGAMVKGYRFSGATIVYDPSVMGDHAACAKFDRWLIEEFQFRLPDVRTDVTVIDIHPDRTHWQGRCLPILTLLSPSK